MHATLSTSKKHLILYGIMVYYTVVSVSEDSYQSRYKMSWSDPEFDQQEPKPWAQAEKCKYSIEKTNTDI